MGMHRDQARRAAGRARIAAAGLAAVGGVVLFAPFPKLGAAPAPATSGPTSPLPMAGPKESPAFDPNLADLVISKAGPEPRPAAVAVELPPDGEPLDTPPVEGESETTNEVIAGAGPALRYLGPIVGPRRTLAMVALDGQQHVLAIGEEIDGKIIRDVSTTQIILDDAQGVEHILARAEQVLDWSMDVPAPASPKGLGSKRLPGGAGRLGAAGDHNTEHPEEAADMEAKRAEAARRASEFDRAGMYGDHADNNPNNANQTARPNRPVPPGSAIPKVPMPGASRGVNGSTPPKYPPARPSVPGSNANPNNRGNEKKAGNSA